MKKKPVVTYDDSLSREVVNQSGALSLGERAILESRWVCITPLPFDNYEILVKNESEVWLKKAIYDGDFDPNPGEEE